MKKFDFLHNKNLKALTITLVILIVMSVFSLSDNSFIMSAVNGATRGLFWVSASAVASADTATYDDVKEENERLKKENAELRAQLADYEEIKKENEQLWNYYGLKKDNPSYTIVPATVIKRSAGEDFYSFTLNIGSSKGVEAGDPVITENGLVGRVSRVDAATCMVSTILSPDTSIGALDSKSGDSGVVCGSSSLCDDNLTQLTKIAEDSKIKEGDMLVTEGTGGAYPKNLVIGKVKELKINSYDATSYAVVEPYEDIRRITSAAVITDFYGKGEIGVKK